MHINQSQSQAFTLIEILVALTIFAIISTITASTMYYAFQTRDRVAQRSAQLMTLEQALTMMEKDFQQITARAVIYDHYQKSPEFIGETFAITFTRSGVANPSSLANRSTLARAAYRCEQGKLIRRSWPMLDQPNKNQYRDKVLLEKLQDCRFAYLNSHLDVLDVWRANLLPGIQKKAELPKAVRFTLHVPRFGTGQFLYIVPGEHDDPVS